MTGFRHNTAVDQERNRDIRVLACLSSDCQSAPGRYRTADHLIRSYLVDCKSLTVSNRARGISIAVHPDSKTGHNKAQPASAKSPQRHCHHRKRDGAIDGNKLTLFFFPNPYDESPQKFGPAKRPKLDLMGCEIVKGELACEQARYLGGDRRGNSLNRQTVSHEFLVDFRRRFTNIPSPVLNRPI
jgi:hypothetical protein